MANVLKMAKIQSIQQLHAAGWSQRRIARELDIDRGTVARHLRSAPSDPNAAILPAGSDGPNAATFSPLPAPRVESAGSNDGADCERGSNPAIVPTGSGGDILALAAMSAPPSPRGRPAQCKGYRELIQRGLDQQLTAQRIWQDLVAEHGFAGSYDSVKRFVRRLEQRTPLPFRRMECGPGEEAQVDFGTGAPVITPTGKRRKTNVFRIVLSHSRKAYSEATFTQTTEDFFRCLENAFAHFGGVPKTLVIDNLKAAVAHPDWFDPELTPKVQSFCRHYGTVILPTKPYTPRHKGKIESGVKYVKNNALKARQFASLVEQNRALADWERTVADTRIHGTTKRQVTLLFEQAERAALLPLPLERFACFHEGKRKVNRDGHVEVARAYYSAPPEYLGREVWVRWDARLVRIFNHRFEQIALHARHEQGRFSTRQEHIVKEKISGLERGASYLLHKVSVVGPFTRQWSEAVVNARGIEGTRVLQGLLSLTKKYPCAALEKACEIALSHGCWRLRAVRKLLGRKAAKQEPLPFLEEHPVIRPMSDYGAIVAQAIQRQADRSSMSEGFGRHARTKVCAGPAPPASTKNPGPRHDLDRGRADTLPPRPGYPSPGCTSAEPGSVSPDTSTVTPPSSFHQEQSYE
jgi:transposase